VAELVHEWLESTAARAPDREALVIAGGDTRLTWADVAAASWRMARHLRRRGVTRGDRVAILAHNGLEYVAAFHGALAAGAVAVPMNSATDPASLAKNHADCGAAALVVGPRLERVAKAAGLDTIALADAAGEDASPLDERVAPTDLAAIIYTSGSTGRPRGACLSHANLTANVRSILAYLPLGEDDRVLALLPFHYVYGQSVLLTAIAVGATLVVENRFQYPNVALDTLERERCTTFSGVPSTFAILCDRSNLAARELPALRWLTQAGGPMSPALTRRVLDALPGRRLFVMYGATEASARLAYVVPEELPSCLGSIGRAIPGVELTVRKPDGSECAVDEVGELCARGPNIMVGYWNDPDETARVLGPHGYLTGDLARRDADGRFWLVGRAKDMLKVGGHRVAAREIEDAILEHPAISEAAVIGVPDEILGDRLEAHVVPRAPIEPADLARFLRERLPAYKIPGGIYLRGDMPRSAAGKIDKGRLRGPESG
jgi:amino acid adenylation domain-containing protein